MKKLISCLTVIILLPLLCSSLLSASDSSAALSIFTVQTGSFENAVDARRQFDAIVRELNKADLEYLRIEKIGKFYTVRIGKFSNHRSAEKFLLANKSGLPGTIVMNAYFKDERIERLYKSPSTEKKQPSARTLPSAPGLAPAKPLITEKDIAPKTLDEQIEKISALVNKKAYDKALEVTESAMAVRPEEHQLIGWHGAVLVKMQLPDKAIAYFRKASELSPAVPAYHSGLGYCLFFLGKFNEAIDEFNETLVLDPVHIDALAGLGVAYGKTGEKEKAMIAYNRLKGIDSDVADKIFRIINE